MCVFFFFQAEDGIRDIGVTGVQTCALPILGETAYSSLEEIPGPVDIVDVFRRAEELPKIARSAADIGANVLWMQLGIVNEEAAQIARNAGLEVVMDRCVKIEHARFFGGLNLVGMNTGVVTSRRRIG